MSWFTSLAGAYPVLVYGAIIAIVAAFFSCIAFGAFRSDGTGRKDLLIVLFVGALALAAALTFVDALWHAGIAVIAGAFVGILIGGLATAVLRPVETVIKTPHQPFLDPR